MESSNDRQEIKVLTIGDPHFKVSNIKECEEMIEKIVQIAKEKKPDFIVCLGDILDRHETIHVSPLTLSIKFLSRLEQIAKLYVIIGNHDRPNNSDFLSNQHPFNAVKEWKNTIVVDKAIKDTIKGHRFVFVPYVPPGRFLEAIDTLIPKPEKSDDVFLKEQMEEQMIEEREKSLNDKPFLNFIKAMIIHNDLELPNSLKPDFKAKKENKIVDIDDNFINSITSFFGHQEFFGAHMGVIISQTGDKWSHEYPLVISGHIHDYDRPQNNIVYTGTPMQHSFGDREDKTISLFTFFSNKKWTEERLNLNLPKRSIVYLDPKNVITWIPPEGKLIKVIIKGTSSEIKATMKLQYIKQLIKKGIKVVYKTLDEGESEIRDISKITPQIPYLQKLYQTVSPDKNQVDWFNKLFGSISNPTSISNSTFMSNSTLNLISNPTQNDQKIDLTQNNPYLSNQKIIQSQNNNISPQMKMVIK